MAIPRDQPTGPGTSVVPPYNPSRPYPVLEPTMEPVVISQAITGYEAVDKIPPDTYYLEPPPPIGHNTDSGGGGDELPDFPRVTTFGDFRFTSDGSFRIWT